ncbi:DNA-methyltransferase [Actinomadura formosensis]|uniref:DNA-methyltransferase n=1 Tax=Actinomadura formosensis TaxID=60706 RepID=UPI0008371779|nr:site-specific DNA-methyltransferase [Actinomadura formosensis]
MRPFYQSERATIYQGDALPVLRALPDNSVDAVIADPPYCSGGASTATRTNNSARSKYVSTNAKHNLASFSGDQRDQRSFTYWCTLWLGESLRLTNPGGVCLVFTDWRQLPSVSDALQAAGWVWRGLVVWHKPGARPSRGRFTNAAEYVVWGSHGDLASRELYLPGFYSVTTPRGNARTHITQKPLTLLRHLVNITAPGATVLDPFLGSGTTGEAAILDGRKFVGVELSEQFAEQAAARIAAAEQIVSGRTEGGSS